MPIGRFAASVRLSVKALRHYDELGLLEPACVDAATGYRYYAPAQAREALLIGMLRELELPLDLGCVVYWLVPTAPPWWAGSNGSMPPVRRIMAEAGERFWRRLWNPLYHSLQGNPFAAMPSLHFGTSVMAARILSQVGPRHAALGWLYALLLGFGLVYLGEHYVIDLMAGLALAEGIWRVAPRIEPMVRFVAGAVHWLEPRAL
jgi:membrane-associated phospholipid phosphatase